MAGTHPDVTAAVEAARTALAAENRDELRAALTAMGELCADRVASEAAIIAGCARCRQLPPSASAFYCGDTSHPLPAPAYELIPESLRGGASRVHATIACPKCGTRYRYDTDYEFLVGGSEDEEFLERLAIGERLAVLQQALQVTPRWRSIRDAWRLLELALD